MNTLFSFKSFKLKNLTVITLLFCVTTLSACGFKLKGTNNLPFNSVYTNINLNTAFGNSLSRYLMASSPGLKFVSDPTQAEVTLTQLSNNQTRRELSLDARGNVEEYELTLDFTFQITDYAGRVILAPTTLTSIREIPYDPDESQAKAGEIAMTFEEMSQSLITRIVRILDSNEINEAYQNRESKEFETDLYYDESMYNQTTGNNTINSPNIDASKAWELQ